MVERGKGLVGGGKSGAWIASSLLLNDGGVEMSKYTQGPWAYNGDTVIETACPDLRGDHMHICDLRTTLGKIDEETRATAYLIAEAPEMLKIIKEMRNAFYVKGTRKALLEVMERSKVVMERAEGRKV